MKNMKAERKGLAAADVKIKEKLRDIFIELLKAVEDEYFVLMLWIAQRNENSLPFISP